MQLFRNHLLRDFPAGSLDVLLPHLELIEFKRGARLYEVGQVAKQVYFPESGIVSLVLRVSGREIESSIVGNEGLVGLPILLGQERTLSEAVIQMEGEGYRLNSQVLEQIFKQGGALQERLLAYIAAVLAQSTQLALCSHVHTPQERLARWLLMVADRVENEAEQSQDETLKFNLAPEFLAQMVGTDIANAAAQVGVMQRAGLLAFSGNKFELCSREEMEDASCDCYHHIRAAFIRSENPSSLSY